LPRVSWHPFRHAHATLLGEVGGSPKTAQSLLGHSDLETTFNTYTHAVPDSQQVAVERVAGVLFFVSHVRGEESFAYILGRTLMRPRELLRFVRDCINVAVNRRHEQVTEDDILHAERSYSDDALVDLAMELKDVRPEFANAPYAFIGKQTHLLPSEVGIALLKAGTGIAPDDCEKVKNLLLWFGFLGIYTYPDDERYSYQFEHNLQKMKSGIESFRYCIHPAFRQSLGCVSS
jgi:hypothetical protein